MSQAPPPPPAHPCRGVKACRSYAAAQAAARPTQGVRELGRRYAGRWLAPVTEDDENRRSSGFTGPRRAGALLWLRNPS